MVIDHLRQLSHEYLSINVLLLKSDMRGGEMIEGRGNFECTGPSIRLLWMRTGSCGYQQLYHWMWTPPKVLE
jgi:hypothetical protein